MRDMPAAALSAGVPLIAWRSRRLCRRLRHETTLNSKLSGPLHCATAHGLLSICYSSNAHSALAAIQVIIEEPVAAVDLLEPILDENRMCVEYRHVSAYVPATVAAGGFFSGWELPKWSAKAKAKEKAKLRRVSQLPYTCQRCHLSLPKTLASSTFVSYKPTGISLL